MPVKISKKDTILKELEAAGKVITRNTEEDNQIQEKMNQRLLKIRKEFQIKESESEINAAKTFVS